MTSSHRTRVLLIALVTTSVILASAPYLGRSGERASVADPGVRPDSEGLVTRAAHTTAPDNYSDGVVDSINLTGEPAALTYDSANGTIFAALYTYRGSNVSVISASNNTVIKSVYGGEGPDALAYDSTNNTVWAVDVDAESVTVLSGSSGSVVGSVRVGCYPDAVAYGAAVNRVFVVNRGGIGCAGLGNVTVISASTYTVIGTITAGLDYPTAIAYDPATNMIYVASEPHNVWIFSASNLSFVANVVVGEFPDALTYDSEDVSMYVANSGSDNLSVISGSDEADVGSVAVGAAPSSLTYNSKDDQILASDENGVGNRYEVSVVSGAARDLIGSIYVGMEPDALVYDSVTNAVYVANLVSNNTSVIGTLYTVSFHEVGLPGLGADWTVALNEVWFNLTGGPQRATETSITFVVPNGTFAYFIRGPAGYQFTGLPPQGSLSVNGANVTERLSFAQGATYSLIFREAGLEGGGFPPVCVTIGSLACSVKASLQWGGLSPGVYTYEVAPVPGETTLLKIGGVWEVQSNGSASLGPSQVIQVLFARAVTFNETGLPNGTVWSVSVAGRTVTASGPTLLIYLPAGTHPFTVRGVPGYTRTPTHGRVVVGGGPVPTVVFTPRRP